MIITDQPTPWKGPGDWSGNCRGMPHGLSAEADSEHSVDWMDLDHDADSTHWQVFTVSNTVASIPFLRCDTFYTSHTDPASSINAFCSLPSRLARANIKSYPLQVFSLAPCSLYDLCHWVLDSACAFSFTFNPSTTTFSNFCF
jgi:hypothetical protein